MLALFALALLAGAVSTRAGALPTPAIVARAKPSVVVVEAGSRQGTAFAFGRPGEYLTNAHVVRGASSIVIVDRLGHRASARVVAEDDVADVARLQSRLQVAALRDALSRPLPGQRVVAIGSGVGLAGTVTEGIVSAVGRSIDGVKMIQTDAALAPGDSGGPLLNEAARVIGVTTSRVTGAEGIAFAIPMQQATRALATPSAQRVPLATSSGSGRGVTFYVVIAAGALLIFLLGGIVGGRAALVRRRRAFAQHPAAASCPPGPPPDEPPVVIRRRTADPQLADDDFEVTIRTKEEDTWT